MLQVKGSREFFIQHLDNSLKWTLLNDFNRLQEYDSLEREGNEIIMKLEQSRH